MRLVENLLLKTTRWSVSFVLILCLFPLFLGVLPGWKKMQSDFPNYFVSASLIANNENVDSLYHGSWFQNQIYQHGLTERGKFSPFPPPSALILVPFTGFDPLTAKRIGLVFNLLLILPITLLISRIAGIQMIGSLILLLLSGIALVNNLFLGQMYLLLLFMLFSAYFFLLKRSASSTGIFLGSGIAIKYFPLVFFPTLLAERKWKTMLSTVIVFFLIHLITVLLVGTHAYKDFFNTVFFQHLNGNLEGQSAWSVSFQSWNSLGHRLFLYDNIENPNPVFPSLLSYSIFKYSILLGLLSASGYLLMKYKGQADFTEASLALSSITVLTLSPAGATYHGILLLFPVTLMTAVLLVREKLKSWIFLLVLLSLIGFLPSFLEKTELFTQSILFKYMRLWIHFTMYLFIYFTLWKICHAYPHVEHKVSANDSGNDRQ